MSASAHDCPTELDLTHEEAWALHAALLVSIEDAVEAGEDPDELVSFLTRVEENADFECDELASLVEVLRSYVNGQAPSRDRRPARNAINNIQTALA
ncbi:hypothetical protein GL213_00325 [Halogeometricum borinquense]|uniref:Uncharacterized protein n=2 Tax=Halogeometricum borinquense TaxID=60847 RepID=E4NRK1_HALBP|nr:hypothetical protein [Halogeometricum borinquense]ADQ65677.1 hypothetical protein Hbor_00640 [Halogeometricum borinquense DSM 11551]ELY27007.1 hypothetical protein C499_10744 [Halogeometricum borinquense DSM 11551]QIB72921.1 hypothetical protein G3I44_00630 [Halogeometricum borinquense]QIQ75121.1 hypothetical protein GL213_00325 [Halogeometricum borinquense]RYJ15133.1 hypothetical protein ELS19_15050 [Halogeometricum borinquense]